MSADVVAAGAVKLALAVEGAVEDNKDTVEGIKGAVEGTLCTTTEGT